MSVYYRIVSEVDSVTRSRRSLSAFNRTSITLEFGNPPAVNISITPPPSIEEEIEMAGEFSNNVDLEVYSEVKLNGYITITLLGPRVGHIRFMVHGLLFLGDLTFFLNCRRTLWPMFL